MCKIFFFNVSKFEFIMANIIINDSSIVGKDKRRNLAG